MSADLGRPPTIEDVARAAGVSRAAVSKVLRDAYGVSEDMRARVGTAMTELHYRPRVAARAMRGRTFTIGIEIPDFSNQFFARILRGVTAELAGTRYQTVIAPAEREEATVLKALDALVDRQVDGIIAVSPRAVPERLEGLGEQLPVVVFGRGEQSLSYDTVIGDDAAGAAAAVHHLRRLGHERIAHLTLTSQDDAEHTPHGIRRREYERLMAADGLCVEVLRTDDGQDAAHEVMREALASHTDATAVFAAHDELAFGVMRAAVDAGRRMSIIGYDDVPMAAHPLLSLSTVRQPGAAMGRRAVQLLLERIHGRRDPVHDVFAPTLQQRSSTRPVSG